MPTYSPPPPQKRRRLGFGLREEDAAFAQAADIINLDAYLEGLGLQKYAQALREEDLTEVEHLRCARACALAGEVDLRAAEGAAPPPVPTACSALTTWCQFAASAAEPRIA
jgi:hypothetical protein